MAGLAFGSVFVVFVIGSVVALVRSDRKRAFHHGRTDRVGVGGAVAPVVALLPRDSAVRIAQEAVRRAGGKKVETVNGSVVVGWMGNPWTNLPKRSEYELAVSVSSFPMDRLSSCAQVARDLDRRSPVPPEAKNWLRSSPPRLSG